MSRCGAYLPGAGCRREAGHAGRHHAGAWSWNNLRDPDCFWCGRKATQRRMVSGFGRATVCDDFVGLSEEHWPGARLLGTWGQGCRVAAADPGSSTAPEDA